MVATRRFRRPGGGTAAAHLVALVTVVVVVVLGTAGTATAGGPTSVLLVASDRGATASLYRSDSGYERLTSLLGGQQPKPAREADPAGTYGLGPYVTVTWLVHDVRIWRVDRIFFEASGGPWIATQEVMDIGAPGPAATADPGFGPVLPIPATWHPAPRSEELVNLLDDLGLLEPGTKAAPPTTPADTAVVAAPAGSAAPPPTAADEGHGWPWGLAGLAAGLLVGAAGTRFAAPRTTLPNPREPTPRRGRLDM